VDLNEIPPGIYQMAITVEVDCFNNRIILAKVTKALILAGSFSQYLELLLFREEVGVIRKYYNGSREEFYF